MSDAGTHIFIASGQPSVFSREAPEPLISFMHGSLQNGKDSGVKVVSGASKDENILAGN